MKRFIISILSLMLLLSLLPADAFAAADSSYTQKVVYLLIDNSGSMAWDKTNKKAQNLEDSRWNSAIYALEAFASLLDENDKLVVRSVGDGSNGGSVISFEANGLSEKTLKSIIDDCKKAKSPTSGTLFKGVKDLYDLMKAKENKASSAEQELWFVVMTDGEFYINGADKMPSADVYAYFKNTITANAIGGKVPQVLYLTICGTDKTSIDKYIQKGDRIRTFNSPDVNNIVGVMEEISDYISGRIRYSTTNSAKANYKVEGKTITFTTEIPMRDVVVLIQNKSKSANPITISSANFTPKRNANIVSPANNLKALMGQYQSAKGGNIQPGTYTMTLSQELAQGDTVTLLFQPALVIRNSYTVIDRYENQYDMTAEELKNSQAIFADSTIITHVHVYEAGGSGKEYAISDLPGKDAKVTVSAVFPGNQVKNLTTSKNAYDYSCKLEKTGNYSLSTTINLSKYKMELRQEDYFQVLSADKDPLYPITGVTTAAGQNVSVSQLTMAREGARAVFNVQVPSDKSIANLKNYEDNGMISATVTGPNGKAVSGVGLEYSSADPTQIAVRIPAVSGAAQGDYQVTLNLGKGRISKKTTIKVTASSLTLQADQGDSISLSRLQLKDQPASISFRLYDNGAPVSGAEQVKASVSPASTAFTWKNGKLTVTGGSALTAGAYAVKADNYCGLPVKCAASVTITEGEGDITVTGRSMSLSQVSMLQNGAQAAFDITYKGAKLTKKEIESLIGAGKLTVSTADGKTEIGKPQADDGCVRCSVSKAWLQPGQYIFTLTVKGDGSKTLSQTNSTVTVQGITAKGGDVSLSQVQMLENGTEVSFSLSSQNTPLKADEIKSLIENRKLTVTRADGTKIGQLQADNGRVWCAVDKAWLQPGSYAFTLAIEGSSDQKTSTVTIQGITASGGDVSLSQVEMLEKGTEVSFSLSSQNTPLKADEIKSLIKNGKLTVSAADGKTKIGDLQADNGRVRCAVDKAWLEPGEYAFTLAIDGSSDQIASTVNVQGITAKGSDVSLSQVQMFEKGTEVSFSLDSQNAQFTQQEIKSLIQSGKLTVTSSDKKTQIGQPQAISGGVRCTVDKAWLEPGEYTFTLKIDGTGDGQTSTLTVLESSFDAEIDPTAVEYDAYLSGTAQVRLTALREKGSNTSLDIGKYQAALQGQAGKWDEKNRAFILSSPAGSRDPIPLDYLVMGKTKGQVTVQVIDPLAQVSRFSADIVQASQWSLLHGPEETVLHFYANGQSLSRSSVQNLIGEFTVEGPKELNTEALSPAAEEGGVSLTVKPRGYQRYQDLPTGEFTFVLLRGGEEFGRAVLRIERSDVKAKNESPTVPWSAFKNNGSMELTLSLWDGEQQLNAETCRLTAAASSPNGQPENLSPTYAGDSASFTVPYPQGFAQGDYLVVTPSAMGETLEEIQVTLQNASYDIRIESENAHIAQMELPQGRRLSVQVLEDGQPVVLSPDQLIVTCDQFAVEPAGMENEGKTAVYTVKCDDVTLAARSYPVKVSYTSTLNEVTTRDYNLIVDDAGYQVKADNPQVEQEAMTFISDGCRVTFSVTHSGGEKVPQDQLLNLFSSLPEKAEGAKLSWEASGDGVLSCTVKTDKNMQDFEAESTCVVSCTLKNGGSDQTVLTVKKVSYAVTVQNPKGELVHTRLHEEDQAVAYFAVVYTDENGNPQGPVPADILQTWIDNDQFDFQFDYNPQGWTQAVSNFFRFGRDRLHIQLETTDQDGRIKASVQGGYNYDGLLGLRGYWHNTGDRWFLPVGTVKTSVSLKNSDGAGDSAEFRIVRDEPIKEWGLYFALPIYIVLSIIRVIIKKKFPWRRLRVTALTPVNEKGKENPNILEYDYPIGKGFFFRKLLGTVLWPLTLIPNIFLRSIKKINGSVWTEKDLKVGDIQVKVKAAGRCPFRHENVDIVMKPDVSWFCGHQETIGDDPKTRYKKSELEFKTVAKKDDNADPTIISMADKTEVLFLRQGKAPSSYGILMKSKP